MCYPLNGSDLSPERNPIEAGLGFFVDLTKSNFIGRDVLIETKEKGPREKLVPFRMKEKGPPPRPHYAVFENGERIGEVTSGTLSPSLNWGVGMAYVSTARARNRHQIDIEIRGQKFPATMKRNRSTKTMNVPDELLYTESHEWIKREGDNVRVGITDHAQSELTDVVYVELPKMDRQANAKEAIAVVESVKAASDIYAPVKGIVVEVNSARSRPGLDQPRTLWPGLDFRSQARQRNDLKQLKDAEAYKKQIG
jgi:glycine cleavage system H protein